MEVVFEWVTFFGNGTSPSGKGTHHLNEKSDWKKYIQPGLSSTNHRVVSQVFQCHVFTVFAPLQWGTNGKQLPSLRAESLKSARQAFCQRRRSTINCCTDECGGLALNVSNTGMLYLRWCGSSQALNMLGCSQHIVRGCSRSIAKASRESRKILQRMLLEGQTHDAATWMWYVNWEVARQPRVPSPTFNVWF